MVAGNANYGTDLLSSTFELFMRDKPTDVIFGAMPLYEKLKANNRIRKDGGVKILEPLMYAKSSAVGSYSGYDLLDVTPQSGLTNAEFDWKQYFGTVTISGEEERKNSGTPKIVDILASRWEQARMSLADLLNTDMFLAGTAGNAKGLTGLAIAVDSAGTYGNIARANNSWWSSVETAVGGVLAIGGATGLRRAYNDVALGRALDVPDLILMPQIVFEAYEALSDANMRFMVTGEGQVTYTNPNLMFKKASLFWDDNCQSGVAYLLNSKYIALVLMAGMGGDGGGDFKTEPFVTPANQDAKVAKFLWMGNLVMSNCARQGKLTGITNT